MVIISCSTTLVPGKSANERAKTSRFCTKVQQPCRLAEASGLGWHKSDRVAPVQLYAWRRPASGPPTSNGREETVSVEFSGNSAAS